jgi:hypothetical protein
VTLERSTRALKGQVNSHFENMTRSRLQTELDLVEWIERCGGESKTYWQELWDAIQADKRFNTFA